MPTWEGLAAGSRKFLPSRYRNQNDPAPGRGAVDDGGRRGPFRPGRAKPYAETEMRETGC